MDVHKILIIDDLGDLCEFMTDVFKDNPRVEIICSKSSEKDLFRNFDRNASLIFINKDEIYNDLLKLNEFIQEYHFYLIIPVVVFSSDKKIVREQKILGFPILMYFLKPLDKEEVFSHVMTALETFDYNLNINDVSGLPCCKIIDRKLTNELSEKSEFSFLFIDLDNFKAYNEYYGLKKGNDVILFFSNLLKDVILNMGTIDDFIGHVGGDDFVIILKDYRNSEKICNEVIRRFEEGIGSFYDEKDLKHNHIEVIDKHGVLKKFPIMGISICAIKYNEFLDKTFDDVYKEIMTIKKEVKKINGSAFLIKE